MHGIFLILLNIYFTNNFLAFVCIDSLYHSLYFVEILMFRSSEKNNQLKDSFYKHY